MATRTERLAELEGEMVDLHAVPEELREQMRLGATRLHAISVERAGLCGDKAGTTISRPRPYSGAVN